MRWTFPEPFLLNGKWLDWHSHLYFLGVHPSVFKKLWPCNKKWKLLYCCTRFWLNVMCVTCNSRQAAISQECDILFVWGRQGDDDDCRSQQTFTNIVAVACGDERIQQVLLSETDQGLNKQQNKMTIPVEQKVVNGTKWEWNCLFRLLDFLLAQWECVDKRMELLITWVHLAQMKNIDTMHDCCLLRAFVITLTENFFVVKRNRLPLSAVFLSYSSTCQTRKSFIRRSRKWSDIFNSLCCFLRHLLKGGLWFNHSQRFPNMDDILSSIHTQWEPKVIRKTSIKRLRDPSVGSIHYIIV